MCSKELKKVYVYMICFAVSILAIIFNAPYIACAIYISVVMYLGVKNNLNTIIGFLILAVFQNITLIILSDYLSPTYNTILSLTKDCTLYVAMLVGIISLLKADGIISVIKENLFVVTILLMFVLVVLKNVLFTPASFMSIIVSVRQMTIPLFCFFCGYLCKIVCKDKIKLIKVLTIVGVALAVFGIVEMILPENCLWEFVNLRNYLGKKISGPTFYTKGVAPSFYTWDFGFLLRRLVSITAEPLATAHLIFVGLALLICYGPEELEFSSKKKYYISVAILTIGCILGFSKGTLVYMAILVIGVLYHKFGRNISVKTLMVIGSVIVTIAVGCIVILYLLTDGDTAIVRHINGLLIGIKNSSLLGYGIGIAGYANQAYTGATVSNGESYVGVNLNQIGYVGVILLFVLWLKLFIINVKSYFKCKKLSKLFSVILMLGMTVDMLLSESSVSIIGTGIYFILLAILSKNSEDVEVVE
jgi:hypothetical protein